MRANHPTWTEQRLERLKAHFQAGLTCRQIADDIGVSRNAVIGKLSRLNLTRGNNDDASRPAAKAAKAAARERRLGKRTKPAIQLLRVIYPEPLPAIDDAPIHADQCCSLLELSAQKCRWPINTPGAADFCFCGNQPLEGLPYCAGHTRLAYRPGSRQRVAPG